MSKEGPGTSSNISALFPGFCGTYFGGFKLDGAGDEGAREVILAYNHFLNKCPKCGSQKRCWRGFTKQMFVFVVTLETVVEENTPWLPFDQATPGGRGDNSRAEGLDYNMRGSWFFQSPVLRIAATKSFGK